MLKGKKLWGGTGNRTFNHVLEAPRREDEAD
jgi:hypothetical protein